MLSIHIIFQIIYSRKQDPDPTLIFLEDDFGGFLSILSLLFIYVVIFFLVVFFNSYTCHIPLPPIHGITVAGRIRNWWKKAPDPDPNHWVFKVHIFGTFTLYACRLDSQWFFVTFKDKDRQS